MAYTREQKKVIRTVLSTGRKMGATRKEMLAAAETGLVESSFRNLNYGDADSKGWRQERQMYYKNPTNVGASAKRYFTETRSERGNYQTPAQLAQAVQRSAFPGRYAERGQQANDILKAFNQGKFGGGSGGTGKPSKKNKGGSPATVTTTQTAGTDNSAMRASLKMQYLQSRGQPGSLLNLGLGLQGAQDVAGATVTSRTAAVDGAPVRTPRGGRDVVTSGGQSVSKMLQKAVKWDKAKTTYLWGGGHGSIAKPGTRVDCSGYVSAVLGLDTPQVSGQLASWGKPGKGRNVSVYANDGHVLMSIRDPKSKKVRWFATSKSNPGGGPGEISKPDASYLSSYAVRHP